MNTTTLVMSAALASLIAGAASAQTTAFANDGATAQAVDDLEEQIADDRDRDIGSFGNEGRTVGSYGSVAMRASSTSNDGDTNADVGIGLRYGTYDGVNGFDVTASFKYGQTNGTETENQLLAGVDYRRDFSDAFFGYGKVEASFDRLTTTVGEYEQDVFVGAGLGYRIFNTDDLQWSIQAGPGYRIAEVVGGDTVNEAAASVSNNVYYSLSDVAYITNDTDVIYSEFATTVTNELAVNVALSDTLSLRTSYATKYNDQTDDAFSDAENTFGASVVYNF
ncbi:DUF481 domain-containing protein [Yoonia sp. 208BN28-4]|uniref:DUF481 domain-containing protein n=1 Tax=Yoonia sp. 208BN28-4 TaxID=3126505 RepID=UPI0030B4C3C2